MNGLPLDLLERLGGIDPAPFFVLSLLPYLAFLRWAARVHGFPRLALRGFQFTLVFVGVTIVAAIVALKVYGRQLADVDPLHGGAEALLTLSNLLVVLGFSLPPLSRTVDAMPPHDGTGPPTTACTDDPGSRKQQ